MTGQFRNPDPVIKMIILFLCAAICHAPFVQPVFAQSNVGAGAAEKADEALTNSTPGLAQTIPLQHPVNPRTYIVGPGDRLVVHFWGQRDENIPVTVGPEGQVFLPNIGLLKASGKTLADLKSNIRWKLKKVYPGLSHDVFLLKPRTFRLHVLGHVERPGPKTANAMTHVSEVVAKAGSKGSTRAIEVWRDGTLFAKADLLRYQRFARLEDNPFVLDNDRIVVPYAGRVIRVSGAVRTPGTYELLDDENIHDLLVDLCGGPSIDISYHDKAWIVRRGENDDQFHTTEFDLKRLFNDPGLAANYPLQNGDTIKIHSANKYQKLVRVEGAVFGKGKVSKGVEVSQTRGKVVKETSGLYPLILGETVSDMIDKAGGAMPWADLKAAFIERKAPNADSKAKIIRINLHEILVQRNFNADLKVLPGDRIVVPATDDQVYVVGAVVEPGPRSYLSNYKAQNYVNMAGGPTTRAATWKAKIIHRDGTKEKYSDMTILAPGDTVFVPEKTFKFWQDYWAVITGVATIAIAGYAVYAASEQQGNK